MAVSQPLACILKALPFAEIRALAKARDKRIPIIALKVGKSEAAQGDLVIPPHSQAVMIALVPY